MRTFTLRGKTWQTDLSFKMAQELVQGYMATGELVRGEFVEKLARAERLSPTQELWLYWFACKMDQKEDANISLQPIFKMLDAAKASGLKYPAIRVKVEDIELKLTLAGSRSRHPGSINVVRTSDRKWLGRVLRSGKCFLQQAVVLKWLERLAAKPVDTCRLYGRRTNHCCFCGKELSNHVSVELGYGPICAGHYGLPHDEAAYEESKHASLDDDIAKVLAERKQ